MPKLLIVDDNDTLRRSLCLEYREREYMVITAKDGEEARQLLFEKDYLPDYAIIDNNMPKLTGMQLIDLMNNKGLTSKIKTVLVSSNPIDNGIDLSSYAVGRKCIFVNRGDTEFDDKLDKYFLGEY